MDLARRARVFPDFSAQHDLGSPKRLADHRFAANGAKHEIQPCGALGFRLAANSSDESAGRAHLDWRALVFAERPRRETVRRARLGIRGRACGATAAARKNLLFGAGVPDPSTRVLGRWILPTLGREGGARRERPTRGSPAALRRHVRLERAGCRRRACVSILATRGTAE